MIELTTQTIIQGEVSEPIEKTEVWYETIMGVSPSLNQCIELCKKYEMDPELCIIPIPVFRSKTMYEVFHKKG